MFHLRLHQADALEWLQGWFRQKRAVEMMRPVGNPPASLIVDVCLQREAELKASGRRYCSPTARGCRGRGQGTGNASIRAEFRPAAQ